MLDEMSLEAIRHCKWAEHAVDRCDSSVLLLKVGDYQSATLPACNRIALNRQEQLRVRFEGREHMNCLAENLTTIINADLITSFTSL